MTSERPLAPFRRRPLEVLANEPLGAYRRLVLADDGPVPAPGQFSMLTAAEAWGSGDDGRPFLPRAFSQLAAAPGRLEFLLDDVGPGTRRLCALTEGERCHVLGPLGNGFTVDRSRRAVLVGGGIGAAPLVQLARELEAAPPGATTLLGFRDAHHAQVADLVPGAAVATDDGSRGHHGLVTALLDAELDRGDPVAVFACGPTPMLEAVRERCTARDVPAQLALESGMACGFGACFACVVPTKAGYVRICVDGPVLAAHDLEPLVAP